jgi:hypothetical protein
MRKSRLVLFVLCITTLLVESGCPHMPSMAANSEVLSRQPDFIIQLTTSDITSDCKKILSKSGFNLVYKQPFEEYPFDQSNSYFHWDNKKAWQLVFREQPFQGPDYTAFWFLVISIAPMSDKESQTAVWVHKKSFSKPEYLLKTQVNKDWASILGEALNKTATENIENKQR